MRQEFFSSAPHPSSDGESYDDGKYEQSGNPSCDSYASSETKVISRNVNLTTRNGCNVTLVGGTPTGATGAIGTDGCRCCLRVPYSVTPSA